MTAVTIWLCILPDGVALNALYGAEARRRGIRTVALVRTKSNLREALATGSFDAVLAISEDPKLERRGIVSELEEELGQPFLHRDATMDRHMTGFSFAGADVSQIQRRPPWEKVVGYADAALGTIENGFHSDPPTLILGSKLLLLDKLLFRAASRRGIPFYTPYVLPYLDNRIALEPDEEHQFARCASEYERIRSAGLSSGERAEAEALKAQVQGSSKPLSHVELPPVGMALPTRARSWLLRTLRQRNPESWPLAVSATHSALRSTIRRLPQRRDSANTYRKRSRHSIPCGPLISYFLHTQPEVTVEHWAFDYQDQVATIRSISARIPATTTLCVKEHPWDAGRRISSFYNELSSIPGVVFLHHSIPSKELIRRSDAVVTLTGTVSLEALALGVPVFTFGNVYYASFRGVHPAKNFDDFERSLASLQNVDLPNDEDLLAALLARHRASHDVRAHQIDLGFDPEQLITAVLAELAHEDPTNS